MPVNAASLLRQGSFLFFLLSRSLSRFSSQIGAVAIGWQIYDLTGRAFDLGMVGLIQFLPTALLVFVAGGAADRYPRKRVVQLCQVAEALTASYLCWGSYAGSLTELQLFAATFVLGIAGAFESPSTAALLPLIAPRGTLQRASAVSSGAGQLATITGPALGGFAYAVAPGLPYGIMVAFWLAGMVFTGAIRVPDDVPAAKGDATNDGLFAGVRFIRANSAILGTISLDLAQRRKQLHPQQRDRDGADAAEHGGRHGAEQCCGDAALELAELVGGVDEQEVHRTDAAAHLVRRRKLHQRETDHDADRIGSSQDRERCDRQPHPVRDREHGRRHAEDDDRLEHPQADVPADRMLRQHDRHRKRTHRGRGAQDAEPERTCLQDIMRIDRQQRGDATEQHREQVERDGAEDR
jgi:hypothetical protein